MSLTKVLSVLFFIGFVQSLVSYAPDDRAADAKNIRYRVELLAANVDPSIIPDRLNADFDEDATFINTKYHGLPDEYVRVSGPSLLAGKNLTVPPCVYQGMQKEEASREEYVECYDRMTNDWYEVPFPDGPYSMELDHVMFWDMNQDGMIDFA